MTASAATAGLPARAPAAAAPSRTRAQTAVARLFDRQRLTAALEGAGAEPAARRKAAIAFFRAGLDEGREIAARSLSGARGGLACARLLSALQDELVRAVRDYVVAADGPVPTRSGAPVPTIVAVGGYGRGTLAPASDVDLLFLLPEEADGGADRIVEAILYVLWDLRQKVGHSTRTVGECLQQAREDMTIRTALLEARLVQGDATLFDRLLERFDSEIVKDTPAEFVAAKLAERDGRLARAGRSRYVVEPNVKEGKGGLRDCHTLFWIAKYVYRVRKASELVDAGLFSRSEFRTFCRCEEFLWRVRCHLHLLTGHAEERLSFDYQRVLAERLGFAGRHGLAGVERFMRYYFLVAKDVGDLTAIVCAALEQRQAKPRAMLDRFMRAIRPRTRSTLPRDFRMDNDRLTFAGEEVVRNDPANLLRLFWYAGRNGCAIHPDATRLVTRSLRRIDSKLRLDADANRLFLDILMAADTAEVVLRLMNQSGVLGRFIPDFGRIVALMQFNMYHHFTVDEHLLLAVGKLAQLEISPDSDDFPLLREIVPVIVQRRALYLALFLHDIAKGRMEDHSLAGVEVALNLCGRFGFTPDETEIVCWLIEHHLVMSDTAQRRDLGDPRTLETFATLVGTLERLRLLLILTVCDIRAVGPGVWNNWKAELLRTLYLETERLLSSDRASYDPHWRVEAAKTELQAALPDLPMEAFRRYAGRLGDTYWMKVDLPHRLRHVALLAALTPGSSEPLVDVRTDSARDVTEITIVAPDHARLLSVIAGSCAAAGANIVDAQVFTTADGVALDTITISRAFTLDDDEMRRAGRIGDAVARALRGEVRLQDMIAARRKPGRRRSDAFDVPASVRLNNTLSRQFTVLEVACRDRTGLLFDLTREISHLELNIQSAYVATFGEKVSDAFYVTDLRGAKVKPGARHDHVVRRLCALIDGPSAKT